VPRSPLTTYAVSLTHGMSGGFLFHSEQGPGFTGSLEQYAQLLDELNYDRVFEQVNRQAAGLSRGCAARPRRTG
jgi:hypothetical protein